LEIESGFFAQVSLGCDTPIFYAFHCSWDDRCMPPQPQFFC
jgi:hypothetical protein